MKQRRGRVSPSPRRRDISSRILRRGLILSRSRKPIHGSDDLELPQGEHSLAQADHERASEHRTGYLRRVLEVPCKKDRGAPHRERPLTASALRDRKQGTPVRRPRPLSLPSTPDPSFVRKLWGIGRPHLDFPSILNTSRKSAKIHVRLRAF